ncbi:MAG TPA: DUF2269 family protein [Solirubrobacteraceae bacterium]|nr:DUF2269 family protein [Solirubrobacteraceae bacterium]
MTFYDVVLTVHILAVVVAFGVVFAYPVIDGYMRRASPAGLAALHRLHVLLATRVITPAMTVVLLAGLYLTFDRWSFEEPWISATVAILFVLFGLTGGFLIPADRRLEELAERDPCAQPRRHRTQAAAPPARAIDRAAHWAPGLARLRVPAEVRLRRSSTVSSTQSACSSIGGRPDREQPPGTRRANR